MTVFFFLVIQFGKVHTFLKLENNIISIFLHFDNENKWNLFVVLFSYQRFAIEVVFLQLDV